jgi:hypothetical protein
MNKVRAQLGKAVVKATSLEPSQNVSVSGAKHQEIVIPAKAGIQRRKPGFPPPRE